MKLLIVLISLLSFPVWAKCPLPKNTLKIAVLDTGFGFRGLGKSANLCKYGHKDFSKEKVFSKLFNTVTPVPLDMHGHGTNIVGIIDNLASLSNKKYCFVIIKFYSLNQTGIENLTASNKALKYVNDIKADFINYSGGGPHYSKNEHEYVKTFLNNGGTFVAAAGNENKNLDNFENAYYPASYDQRIIVVGNKKKDIDKTYNPRYILKDKENKKIERHSLSSYGKMVDRWEEGENVTAYGITMTGTSQATAIATGKIIVEKQNKCDK